MARGALLVEGVYGIGRFFYWGLGGMVVTLLGSLGCYARPGQKKRHCFLMFYVERDIENRHNECRFLGGGVHRELW
jgi:hypothetical protein